MVFLQACMWWADAPFIGIADRLVLNSFASENAACKTILQAAFFVFWQEIFPLSVKLHEQMRLFAHKCVFLHYYTHLTHGKQTEKEALVAERQVQI